MKAFLVYHYRHATSASWSLRHRFALWKLARLDKQTEAKYNELRAQTQDVLRQREDKWAHDAQG